MSSQDQSRLQLIQRATTRLRRRLLEEKLQDLMRHLVHVQAKLESIRVDTVATIANVSDMPEDATEEGIQKMNRQMDVLEKRLESHQLDLVPFLPPSAPSVSSQAPSTRATSVVSDISDRKETHLPDDYQRREKRRRRVKNQKRRYQESVVSYPPEECSDCTPIDNWHHHRVLCTTGDEEEQDDPFYDLAGKRSFRAGSFCGSVYGDSLEPQFSSQLDLSQFSSRRRQRRKNSLRHESLGEHCHPLHTQSDDSDYTQSNLWEIQSYVYSERNVLDEAMSFLDNVGGEDDGGFREDLYLLLKNPDLCCRPFSEIENTMHELRQQRQTSFILPIHHIFSKLTLSTLQWCRFLSILSAAVVVSVLKGPDDLLSAHPISR